MTVLIGARDVRQGEEAAAALRAGGGDAHTIVLDVTDQATVRAAAEQIQERFGHLDVLVNAVAPGYVDTDSDNAGWHHPGRRGPGQGVAPRRGRRRLARLSR